MRVPGACVIAAALAASSCDVDTRDVELSYQETHGYCTNCYGFDLRFSSGGHVWFTGLEGCATPGTHQLPDTGC